MSHEQGGPRRDPRPAGTGWLRRRRADDAGGVALTQATYEAAMSEWLRVFRAAAEGDLEARAMAVPGAEEIPHALEVRSAINLMLDRVDAYVRESAASLEAASGGRFYRRFLLGGMAGSFRNGARTINSATEAMASTQERLDVANQRRLNLADELERTVAQVAEQLAAASTELSATAAGLAESARHAVTEADNAGTTVRGVESAAASIDSVVKLISGIARQTQLLALNATIEAARAGEAGRGFAVVAGEVKTLADTTARSTEQITEQVRTMQQATSASSQAMGSVEATVREMSPMVDAVWVAVDGSQGEHSVDGVVLHGLAQMAEMLRAEVGTFLVELRS